MAAACLEKQHVQKWSYYHDLSQSDDAGGGDGGGEGIAAQMSQRSNREKNQLTRPCIHNFEKVKTQEMNNLSPCDTIVPAYYELNKMCTICTHQVKRIVITLQLRRWLSVKINLRKSQQQQTQRKTDQGDKLKNFAILQ